MDKGNSRFELYEPEEGREDFGEDWKMVIRRRNESGNGVLYEEKQRQLHSFI